MLMEKFQGQKELNYVFVDLEKVYDRVQREELWFSMRDSGVAVEFVRLVQDMYKSSVTVVRCTVGVTDGSKMEVEVCQGSARRPFLFSLVMDRLTNEVGQEYPVMMIFADDIVICSESREQVEETWRGGGVCWKEDE